jgi:hypothetical protein
MFVSLRHKFRRVKFYFETIIEDLHLCTHDIRFVRASELHEKAPKLSFYGNNFIFTENF